MQASSCDFRVTDGSELLGKLTVSFNIHNKTTWSFVSFLTSNRTQGFVELDENNYKLIKETNHKTFGTIINFSLSDFNPRIRYTLISGKHTLYCMIENYMAGTVPNKNSAYYFPIG